MSKVKTNLGLFGLTLAVMHTGGTQFVYAASEQITAAQSVAASEAPGANDVVIAGLLNKARYWKANGRIDLAVKTWSRILQSNPQQQDALAGMTMYQVTMGHTVDANDYLNRLKRVNPKHPTIVEAESILFPQAVAPVVEQDAAAAAISTAGFDVKLASRNVAQGNLQAAEASYMHALKAVPGFPDALLGIAEVMLRQNRFDEALGYVDQHDALHKPSANSSRLRGDAYAGKGRDADKAGDTTRAISYYLRAHAVNPNDPWVSLSLARGLRMQGDSAAANSTIAKLADGAHTRDQNYAASIFYSEEGKWEQVLVLLDQIPEADRTEPIKELRSRSIVYVKSELAKRLYADKSSADAVSMLSSVENDAEGKPELVSVAASAWMDIKQPNQAIALLEHNAPLAPNMLSQYAGLLLETNQDVKLQQLFDDIDSERGQYPMMRGKLEDIRIALCIRQADKLRLSGDVGQGQRVLEPMLRKYPQDINLLLAQGRLLGAQGFDMEVLNNADRVLAMQPGNHEALRQAVSTAVHMNDFARADSYLESAKADDPNRKDLYLEAAHAAEAVNNNEHATLYFAAAGNVGHVGILASPELQFSGSEVQHDWYVDAGFSRRYKSGMSGLGNLYESEIPVALHRPLEDQRSSLVFKAIDVKLDAGDAALALDLFGTNLPAAPVPVPYPVNAHGVAVSVGYQSTSLSADIGLSPVGFAFDGTVGGVRWNHDIAGANVAFEASRRSVTESVLSYAGAVDNVTLKAWGGVSKTGGQASVYYPIAGHWAGYVSGGLYGYSGHNTAHNTSNHMSGSLIYELAHSDDFESTLSARISRVGFNNNQNYFYWGHGGYYSPQRDASFTIPLRISGKTQKVSYEFNVSSSLSDVVESSAQIYPTEPLRQAALGAAGTTVGSNVKSKSSWAVDWIAEYMLGARWALGNRFHIAEARSYQQVGTMLYLRYDFEAGRKTAISTNALRPYYLTTQGGAGLN